MAAYSKVPASSASTLERDDFLSSHPATPSRIETAKEAARRFGAPPVTEGATDYHASLDGLLFGDDPREGFVRGRDFLHGDFGITFTVPEGFTLRNTPDAVLASDGDKRAIRFDAVSIPPNVPLSSYLRSGWVNGLVRESVREGTVNGLEAASAAAIVEGWSFRIGALRDGPRAYRFIFASSAAPSTVDAAFDATFESFRKLSRADRAQLRPQRLRVVTVRAGETPATIARRMPGVAPEMRLTLFAALNGIGEDETLRPGERVKIVAE
jgi:predicted Zn-dependent protease